MEQQDEVRVAWGTGIAGHVAESGEPVNIPDAYQVSIQQVLSWGKFDKFECQPGHKSSSAARVADYSFDCKIYGGRYQSNVCVCVYSYYGGAAL